MSYKYSLTLAGGIALVLAAALLTPTTRVHAADASPATQPGQATLNVGTASIQEIFDGLNETKAIKANLDDHQSQMKLKVQQMEKSITDLQNDLSMMKPDSPQYATQNQQLTTAKINLQVFVDVSNADIEHQNKVQLKRVFNEIQSAVQKVAMSEGYDLIIDAVTPELPADGDLDKVQPDQLSLMINQRTVLYNDKKKDISHDVIVQMNDDFAKSK